MAYLFSRFCLVIFCALVLCFCAGRPVRRAHRDHASTLAPPQQLELESHGEAQKQPKTSVQNEDNAAHADGGGLHGKPKRAALLSAELSLQAGKKKRGGRKNEQADPPPRESENFQAPEEDTSDDSDKQQRPKRRDTSGEDDGGDTSGSSGTDDALGLNGFGSTSNTDSSSAEPADGDTSAADTSGDPASSGGSPDPEAGPGAGAGGAQPPPPPQQQPPQTDRPPARNTANDNGPGVAVTIKRAFTETPEERQAREDAEEDERIRQETIDRKERQERNARRHGPFDELLRDIDHEEPPAKKHVTRKPTTTDEWVYTEDDPDIPRLTLQVLIAIVFIQLGAGTAIILVTVLGFARRIITKKKARGSSQGLVFHQPDTIKQLDTSHHA
eukprot:gnl/Spiro4/17259_TR9183_c0_g1_i1.p2 gnl/Spiro4/17259_TR9183_c0_g1~~gnl/Spiro4/17259_TR9183_c0_g1_i1.p2  ORF type:complete len:409 (+),score=120.00 gnl/Spiro4/17259_TR9183_c0_g1_i1:71-1228(+)